MQTATDRMIDDAVAMYENFVSRAMDPIGVFGITIVEGQVLPAAEGASSRQAHAIDNGEIDKSAAPDDAVTIDMILIRTEPGRPWPARGEEPPAQHLPKLNQVVRGAHDPNAPGFSAAGFSAGRGSCASVRLTRSVSTVPAATGIVPVMKKAEPGSQAGEKTGSQ